MTETETQRGGKAESLKCKLKLPGGLGRRGPAFPERREGRGSAQQAQGPTLPV